MIHQLLHVFWHTGKGRNGEANYLQKNQYFWDVVPRLCTVGPDVSEGFNSFILKVKQYRNRYSFFLHFLSKLCKKRREYSFRICHEIQ